MTLDFFLQRKNGPWDGSVDGKVWFGKDRTVFFFGVGQCIPQSLCLIQCCFFIFCQDNYSIR